MEYIKGVPLTEYCNTARLSVRQRLELFVPVCQAVQHAHQKGIIHHDLKPSNILVALYDGKPVPKVIDFGLAKAIHQPLTERTLYTAKKGPWGLDFRHAVSPSRSVPSTEGATADGRLRFDLRGAILYDTKPAERRFCI
jgi:serine/threonine protein kinase